MMSGLPAGDRDVLLDRMVEVHLHSAKRYLGRVVARDSEGLTVYCVPVAVIDTLPAGIDLSAELPEMLHVLFFPWSNVEYLDVGGEPVGFDTLFSQAFGGTSMDKLFRLEGV